MKYNVKQYFVFSCVSANELCLESANSFGTGNDSRFISAEHDESLRKSGKGEMEVTLGIIEGGEAGDNCWSLTSASYLMKKNYN